MNAKLKYDINDYLTDDDFILAIVSNDQNKIEKLEEFIKLHPQEIEVIEQAKDILLGRSETSTMPDGEKLALKQGILKIIELV
ncbi:hypothetical protein [uncultured Bacteroides sp.]|uniref:hypothetical protein n=1 Tax=uncultured Bacteroides sp. TaxID=162156 RepID=UPI002AAA62D9|nr:hypothetical protein [uncultured Bacteroides sp.]